MEEFLSNEEIDALLDLFQNEGMPEELAGGEGFDLESLDLSQGQVAPLDLLKPNRFTRGQLLAIAKTQDVVARRIGGTVADRLRLDVKADCVAVEQLRFGSWLELLENPLGVYVLKLEPLEPPAVLTVSAGILHGTVDRILGGTGDVEQGLKEFSEAEYAAADALILPVIDRVAEGISEIVPVKPTVVGRYTNAATAQVLPPQEVVLALHFQLTGEPLFGDLRFAVPFPALEPHLAPLAGGGGENRSGHYREIISSNLKDVSAVLAVELGRATIRLKDLLVLKTGDVLRLDTGPGDPVRIPVQGRPKFHGRLGVFGRRMAVRIGEVLATQ